MGPNAAWGCLSCVALWAAIAAFVGAAIFLVLAIIGFRHGRHTPADAELQPVGV